MYSDQKFESIMGAFDENLSMLISGAARMFKPQEHSLVLLQQDELHTIAAKDLHVATLQAMELSFLRVAKKDKKIRCLDNDIMQRAIVKKSIETPIPPFNPEGMSFRDAINVGYYKVQHHLTGAMIGTSAENHKEFHKRKQDLSFAHHVTNYLYATQSLDDIHFYEQVAAARLAQKFHKDRDETTDPVKQKAIAILLEPLEDYFANNDFSTVSHDKRLKDYKLSPETIAWTLEQNNRKNQSLAL